jgi:hypothetical protein
MESQSVVRRKTPVRKVLLLVGLVALLAALPALAVASTTAVVPENVRGPLRVASVSAPESVEAYESINVRLTLAGEVFGSLNVNLQYAAYFATIFSGATQMTPVGGRTYEASIPGFPSGTEVWFAAGVTAGTRAPTISQSYTVQVGTVLRDGASNLKITDVTHTQSAPNPQVPVTVEATVTSLSPIAEVDVAYMAFCPEQLSMPVDPSMTMAQPQRYTITITTPEPCSFAESAVLLYRVLAVDASGNTAVSDAYAVEMRGETFTPWR